MVIDSTDLNRLHLAEQELHQMMESDVSKKIDLNRL
jgi:ADP-ribosylation factor-like protein 5B